MPRMRALWVVMLRMGGVVAGDANGGGGVSDAPGDADAEGVAGDALVDGAAGAAMVRVLPVMLRYTVPLVMMMVRML